MKAEVILLTFLMMGMVFLIFPGVTSAVVQRITSIDLAPSELVDENWDDEAGEITMGQGEE